METIEKLHKRFREHEEGRWIISLDDAQRLEEALQGLKPQNALELGTGIGMSTSVIARNVEHLNTVEQYQKCIETAKELVPTKLQKRITFHYAYPVVYTPAGFPYLRFNNYSSLPKSEELYDFVFLDGPGPWMQDGYYIELPNGDVFQFLNQMRKGAHLFVDSRVSTVQFIASYLSKWVRPVHLDSRMSSFIRTEEPFREEDVVPERIKNVKAHHGKLPLES